MGLGAGQGARIAAEEGKVRRKFLAKRHVGSDSFISSGAYWVDACAIATP